MTKKWYTSNQPELEFRVDLELSVFMLYRCRTCGVEWEQRQGDSPRHHNEFGALWKLHGRPHEKTDAILAESIAIQMGAF